MDTQHEIDEEAKLEADSEFKQEEVSDRVKYIQKQYDLKFNVTQM